MEQETRPRAEASRSLKPCRPVPRGMLREVLMEFTSTSSLHGMHYITERGLTRLEKIFWAILTLTSIFLCLWACSRAWYKWQHNSMIITVNEELMSATEVPFPAVTVCPQTKLNQDKYNYTKLMLALSHFTKDSNLHRATKEEIAENMKNFTEQTPFMRQMGNVDLICKSLLYPPYFPDADDKFIEDILQAAPTLKDIFLNLKWRGKIITPSHDVQSYLYPVLTAEGLCFTFNGLAADEIFNTDNVQPKYILSDVNKYRSKGWSPEQGYFSTEQKDGDNRTDKLYPRRGEESKLDSPDFRLTLQDTLRRDFLCDGTFFQGFKVFLHHPADLPQSTLNYYAAQAHERVTLAVKVNVVTTSDSLTDYTTELRQCYFPSERALKHFKLYTPSNCRLECLTNHTIDSCGCAHFYMPHDSETPLCTTEKNRKCVEEVLGHYVTSEGEFSTNSTDSCICLQLCHSVQYEAEPVRTNFDFTAFDEARHKFTNELYGLSNPYKSQIEGLTRIEMYFKDAQFVTMRRKELFGATDFLAECGGLGGVFLGFSFLSLVELIYFCTLRLFCKFSRQTNEEKENNCKTVSNANELQPYEGTRVAKE
ncbi:pickpocket protein 28-like [Leguminivora glycinivorella]|uniref:pickpocket protein 28-like n=1 Tax=Leguminivora glycinivorella TaxID=1035111 RepID=UPI00200E1E8C|nr:pickpocket protein 28-like [Leguminivora glycinivorella]